MRTHVLVVTVTLALALLAGCGGSDSDQPDGQSPTTSQTGTGTPQDEPADQAAPGGPGQYAFEYAGAIGSVLVPTPSDDQRVAEVEAYRKEAGAEPVTYFVAEVDNMAGTDDINMYGIVVVTADGQQIEATGLSDLIGEWQNSSADYNRGVELINENQVFLRPGTVGTAILAAPGSLDAEPARVYVLPAGGMDEVEATRIEAPAG